MEREANYALIGLFVCAAILGMVLFTSWLAGVNTTGDYSRYTIYFTDSVSGLERDSPVRYKGVAVGKVIEMRITSDRIDLVKVDIEVKSTTPVYANTSARIESQGITGVGYVQLASSPNGKEPVPRRDEEKYPVLNGTGNRFDKFMDQLPAIGTGLEATMSSIREFTNSGGKTLESIRGLTDKLKDDPSQILRPPRKGVEIPK